MPAALTQKAREEQEEKRVLKRLEEKRLKDKGIEVVKPGWKPSAADSALGGLTAAPKQPRTQVTKSGSRLVNPSKTVNPPVVVADTSVKKHLYGWGGTRSKVLGSKDGSTDSIGEKNKQPKKKGTKTPPTFMPDPTKIY